MKKFTQAELLEEGFWDGFKKVARAGANVAKSAYRGGKHIAKTIAPEVTQPIGRAVQNVKDFGTAIASPFKEGPSKSPTNIKNSLLDMGYMLDPTRPPKKFNKNTIVFAQEIENWDQNTGQPSSTKPFKPFIVGKDGSIRSASQSSRNPNQTP